MKTTLLIAFLLVSIANIAQEGMEIIIIDNLGRMDTVIFGNNTSGGTTGIDSELGEIDLFDIEMDSLEIRSIQRDSINHLCVTGGLGNFEKPLYFAENIDLKIDLRGGWSYEDDNFEFIINAVEYPITLIADFTKWYPSGMWFTHLYLLKEDCGLIGYKDYYHQPYEIDTLIIDSIGQLSGIMIKMEHEVGVIENSNDIIMQISPNPIKEVFQLNILNSVSGKSTVNIYSSCGQLLESQNLENQNCIFNISSYSKGIYLLQYKDEKGNTVVNKIVKE